MKKIKPNADQAIVERRFRLSPRGVRHCGPLEIGDQYGCGFIVRALDYGGVVFEDQESSTLAEAMASPEQGLAQWCRDQGLD